MQSDLSRFLAEKHDNLPAPVFFEHFEYCVGFDNMLEYPCHKTEGENHDRTNFREF